MALIVASGVLPLSPAQRPEASRRLAISLACSGCPALRRTSIATCLADSPFFAVAMVASFSSLLVVVGAVRSDRCRRRSVLTALGVWPWGAAVAGALVVGPLP